MGNLQRRLVFLAKLLLCMATFSCVVGARNVGQLKEQCEKVTGPQILPPAIIVPRPDYDTEGFQYSEEAITGYRCFSLEVLLHRRYLTVHLSLRRHNNIDVCKGFEVKRVEFLALAYYGDTLSERRERKPFGRMFRPEDMRYDSISFVCDPKNRPYNETHVEYATLPVGNVAEWEDCRYQEGGFVHNSSSSSFRIQKTGPGGLGPQINGTSPTVLACVLWSYEGINFLYPDGLQLNKSINMEFIAEVDMDNGGKKWFRSVSKISRIMEEVVTSMPGSLLCPYPVSTTTTPSTTTKKIINPSANKTNGSTTTTTTRKTTTPTPIYEDLPCLPFQSCGEVDNYLKIPRGDRFFSFYDPVYSDACKCYNQSMQDNFRLGKYKYGGIHYGLPIPNTPKNYRRAPFKAVIDPVLKDCLQFYFDMDTGCVVFIMESCPGADPIVSTLEIIGINIFALGSRDAKTSEALPFGAWMLVDESVGNCGNLINDKAPKAREQVYSKNHHYDTCSTILHYRNHEFGMPDSRRGYHLPNVLRVQFEKKITLKPSGGKNQSYVLAARLETLNFDTAHMNHRPLYLTFVLEAITNVQTKYNTGVEGLKQQIISMKTPIVNVTYDQNPFTSHLDLSLHSSENNAQKHPLKYLQLKEDWHDEFYLKDKCIVPYIFLPVRPVNKPPIGTKDDGHESTCKCFSPNRVTTAKSTHPTNVTQFVARVSKAKPQGDPITENCFVFGSNPVTTGAGDNSTACTDGATMKHHRVMVYFGLTCAGQKALEIMDMTIISLNHKGYPVGFWDNIDLQTDTQDCRDLLVAGSGMQSWQVRNIRAIWDYTCPPTDLLSTQEFDPEESFFHDKEPHMLLFNHNVTLEDGQHKNHGFCAWWYFKHKYNNHVTHDTRNFYFDFQFVATSFVEHRPSKTTYLVTHRQPRLGFNVKTCTTDKIHPSPTFKDIYINDEYFKEFVDQRKQECIIPLSQIDTFSTGMCGCFVGVTKRGEKTNRLNSKIYPDNHTIAEDVKFLQSCLELSYSYTNNPQKYSIVVSWKLTDSYQCKDRFIVYEVLLQAIDNEGLPMGFWDTTLVTSGDGCSHADRLGDAKVRVFFCPVSDAHVGKYNTYELTTNILHFQNVWKDKHYNWICGRWRFPANYTYSNSHKFADNFQFYSQTNVLDTKTGRWLTAPFFTASKKIKFDRNGYFSEDIIRDSTIVHNEDFNNYLDKTFDKESDNKTNCLITHPPHPDYESHMCKMFHARKSTVDLDNEDMHNTEWNHYKHCFKFDAFPGNEPLSMHLKFRQDLTDTICNRAPAVHFALTAYNEDGFPVGRIGTSLTDRSWTHYDHPFVTNTDPRFCKLEDVTVAQETIQPIEYTMCPFFPLPSEGLTETTMGRFYKQKVNSQELPGMISFAVHSSSPPEGICFHWAFDQQAQGQETPKFVQFYLEFFAPHSQENLVIGTEFVKRSAKYRMKYMGGDSIPPIKNPPINCHDNPNKDPYNFFEIVPVPKDNWQKIYNYTIYPNKEMYRKCLSEYNSLKTCATRFKEEDVRPPVNPIVVIPGLLGPEDDVYNHRYDSTKGIYDGCVTEKLCFSPIDFFRGDKYSECINQMNCQLVWAVGKQPIHPRDAHLPDPDEDGEYVLEIYAATKGYAALGISLDKKMGEDFVLECVKNGTSEKDIESTVHTSWNIAKSETKKVERGNIRYAPSETAGIARLVTRRSDESSVYCVYYIQSSFQARSLYTSVVYDYDLQSETYCMLTAYGERFNYEIIDRNKTIIGIGSHNKGEWKGFATCRDHTDLSKRLTPTRTQVKILQSHGVIMTIAYVGLLSFSSFVARYYKYSLIREYYSYPLWVWFHGATAVAAAVLVLVGTILMSVGKTGWNTPLTSPFHKFMGYNAIVLTFINIPLGFYIRKQDWFHQRNALVYLVHCVGGHFGLVLGILIVMLVRHVEYAFVPCSVGHLGIAFTLIYFAIHSAMSFNRYWLNKLVSGEKKKEYTLTPFILLTQNAPLGTTWHEEYPKATLIRKIVLGIFLVVVLGFTIPIAYLTVSSDHSCILEGHYEALRY